MKVAFICYALSNSNANKQPWCYVVEIARRLRDKGHIAIIVTDGADPINIDGIHTHCLKRLTRPFIGETEQLIDLLDGEQPDRVVLIMGISSFLRTQYKIKQPVIGVMTSPIYNLKELIKNVGMVDLIRFHRYTMIHILNSLIPSWIINKWVDKFSAIVFLSNWNKSRFQLRCHHSIPSCVIPPGVNRAFFEPPINDAREKMIRELVGVDVPVILYYTSPLELRGSKILIHAFADVRKQIDSRLVILSRNDNGELSHQEQSLLNYAKKLGVMSSIFLLSKYFSPDKLRDLIAASNVVCLPFKLVISDVPISILETLAIGKPLVSTNVASIPEIVGNHNWVVRANNCSMLATTLMAEIKEKNAIFTTNGYKIVTWELVGEQFLSILNQIDNKRK